MKHIGLIKSVPNSYNMRLIGNFKTILPVPILAVTPPLPKIFKTARMGLPSPNYLKTAFKYRLCLLLLSKVYLRATNFFLIISACMHELFIQRCKLLKLECKD